MDIEKYQMWFQEKTIIYASPDELFFTSVTAFGHKNISAQKIKKRFFSKISSIL